MFGADTALVMDAVQIAALTAAASAGAVILIMRRRKQVSPQNFSARAFPVREMSYQASQQQPSASSLEERVRVLERIATNGPADLAKEIEALRGADTVLQSPTEQEMQKGRS